MAEQQQRYRQHSIDQPEEPQQPLAAGGDGAGELAQRAASFRKVAEEAYSQCVSGAEALQELARRRNTSGQ
jgi:hypothetical protein